MIQLNISVCFAGDSPLWPREEGLRANVTLKDKECLIPCDGLYADIENFDLRQITMAGW